ncbi:hypothetical protein KI912_003130 [Salmonella enterica]|nr:hypothetical protein [Salmonella enterica]
MTTTLNPTITITVSGPTGSGKSRVPALIADALKLCHGDGIIIDSPELASERRMNPRDYASWHSPRSGTLFKLEEINHPINTGRCIATPITVDDLVDRPVPVSVQALMCKPGISFEEHQETDLQPVIDLVNRALMTPQVPVTSAEETQSKQPDDPERIKQMVRTILNTLSPGNQAWPAQDAIHAVIAALFTLYDQSLVLMELRKIIGHNGTSGTRIVMEISPFTSPDACHYSAETFCNLFSRKSFRKKLRRILQQYPTTASAHDIRASTEAFRAEIMKIIKNNTSAKN